MFFSSRRLTVRCFLQLLNRVCKLLATNESGRICKCRMPVLCQRTYNYVTGRLEDSERQNDEKTSRETAHSRSCETIFCHSAVLSLAGKPRLRQMPVLWLVLSRSGFCSTDRFHGNGPTRVFLFWREAGKFKICNQKSEKKKTVNIVILHSETTRRS